MNFFKTRNHFGINTSIGGIPSDPIQFLKDMIQNEGLRTRGLHCNAIVIHYNIQMAGKSNHASRIDRWTIHYIIIATNIPKRPSTVPEANTAALTAAESSLFIEEWSIPS